MPIRVLGVLSVLSVVSAHGPVNSLPPGASYIYTTPALYLNLTVANVTSLGSLSTGGAQLLGNIVAGHLYSEPEFEIQFNGKVKYAEDYLTADSGDGIARPACVGTIVPEEEGALPFLFRISGIDQSSLQAQEIFSNPDASGRAVPYGYSYSVWTPTFYGGSGKYAVLQNSIFVASETVSDSHRPGYFAVGMKISKVWPVNTSITIGNEYP